MIGYVIVAILILSAIIIYAWSSRNRKIVDENSRLLKQLHDLNGKYSFDLLKGRYAFKYRFDKKRKYDRTGMDEFFSSIIEENIAFFEDIINKISNNRKHFSSYMVEYDNLATSNTKEEIKNMKVPRKTFLKIERRLYKKRKASPVLDSTFDCTISYTSPKGRNRYRRDKTYSLEIMHGMYKSVVKRIDAKNTRQYLIRQERLKMTNSMRYDIMKRDGFKCCICGATSKIGANLHVDHIIPVSKGGKSEPGNLQTLCDRCNMGKSNKM